MYPKGLSSSSNLKSELCTISCLFMHCTVLYSISIFQKPVIMKPSPRVRKPAEHFKPATRQDQLMSDVKKKKRNAKYEKERKKVQREKQVETKDQEWEPMQTNQMDKGVDLLDTNKMDKQNEKNSNDTKLPRSPQLAQEKSKK